MFHTYKFDYAECFNFGGSLATSEFRLRHMKSILKKEILCFIEQVNFLFLNYHFVGSINDAESKNYF